LERNAGLALFGVPFFIAEGPTWNVDALTRWDFEFPDWTGIGVESLVSTNMC